MTQKKSSIKSAKKIPASKVRAKATDATTHITDLNCDMGEGIGNEAAILPFISSANIACGYHAGDEKTIWETIQAALKYKVALGAHPSYLDRDHFGRRELDLSPEEVYDLVTQQLLLFNEIVNSANAIFHHVKPHGALYNTSAKDKKIANAIGNAVKDFDSRLILFGLSGSHSIKEAKAIGLLTASEAFADRGYQDDGRLVPRSEKDGLVNDKTLAVKQALQIVKNGSVTTISGKIIPIQSETICIHGDGKNAVQFASEINLALKENNIDIKAI